jgi:hypothetical protein
MIGQPPPELRNPLELSLYVAITLVVFRTAIGAQPLPGSLAEQPDLFGQTSAIFMVGGSLVATIGLLWRWDRMDAFVIYQAGVGALSPGCLMYALALYWVTNDLSNIAIVVAVFGGLGVGCVARWFQVNRWWRRERRRARKVLGVEP